MTAFQMQLHEQSLPPQNCYRLLSWVCVNYSVMGTRQMQLHELYSRCLRISVYSAACLSYVLLLAAAVGCGCVQAAAAAAAGQWYPPVRSTLLLLSKLYRCIDTRIFAGLAQEAVAACTACVQVRDTA
jgi:hypothetical protein